MSNPDAVLGGLPLGIASVAAAAVLVAGVADILRHPSWAWRSTGHSRMLALALVVLVPVIGAAVYLLVLRDAVDGATRAGRAAHLPLEGAPLSGTPGTTGPATPTRRGTARPSAGTGTVGAPVRIQLPITPSHPFVPTASPLDTLVRERAPASPSGWKEDPTGRHQFRFWDGFRWTDSVADSGVRTTDPVTA